MSPVWEPPGLPPTAPPLSDEWGAVVRDRLFQHRTVLLRGMLDDGAATRAAAELMTLDATGDARVTFHVDAWGGTLEAAFAVMDVVDLLGVPVHVLCSGRADGPAVGIVAVGTRRACTPHARFRLRDAETAMHGSAADLSRFAEHHLEQVRRFHERVAAAVHQPVDVVAADCASGRFLTAQEALAYGLVDEVAAPRGSVYPLPGRTVGFKP
ncbi:MAG TPA: ATP-dependent Clp protease proteolytic subunit [Acidimicrobiales bacterium]|nr:ATP-dependent Clp protease proteolytic subunit [Acidimicrobiales bacterium]